MKITGVAAYLLSFPSSGFRRDTMLVRIASDEGLFGYAPAPAGIENQQAIERIIAPFLTGSELNDPETLGTRFQQGPGSDAALSRIYGAAEIALYDLAAKSRGVPVSDLVGGRVRDRVRVYATSGTVKTPDAHLIDAIEVRAAGIAAFKIRLSGSPAQDLETVRIVRETAGAGFEIVLDASAYSTHDAREIEPFLRALREFRIRFVEDPLPTDDHAAYARLRTVDLIPLAAGRSEPSELRFLDLIETAGADYIEMDMVSQGGYGTARRLLPDIARAGLRFTFSNSTSNPVTALETAAAAQLAVCWPESVVRWVECPLPSANEMLRHPLTFERGELVVPRAPGLGIDVDESVIWRFPFTPDAQPDDVSALKSN
jgi:L-alanine-DL-glutamate epimerase-like enolase superfamily enzyme